MKQLKYKPQWYWELVKLSNWFFNKKPEAYWKVEVCKLCMCEYPLYMKSTDTFSQGLCQKCINLK